MSKRMAADISPADRIRYQLLLCGLSQRGAARKLGIDARTMRKYCLAERGVPRILDYAMQGLIAERAKRRS